MKTSIFCLLLSILLSTVCFAGDTFYVDIANGDDGRSCATAKNISTPRQHIRGPKVGNVYEAGGGLDCLTPGNGDILDIRAGTYNESFVCDYAANNCAYGGTSWENATTIRAHAGETVTVRPPYTHDGHTFPSYTIVQGIIFDDVDAETGMVIGLQARSVRLQNIEVKNAYCVGLLVGSKIHSGGDPADEGFQEVLNSSFHDIDLAGAGCHGWYVGADDNLFEGNVVYNVGYFGAQFYEVYGGHPNRNIIRNNIFHNACNYAGTYGAAAALLVALGSDNQVYDNLIYDNNCYGLELGYGVTSPRVYNNTIVGNTLAGIHFRTAGAGVHTPDVRNNITRSNGTDYTDDGGVDNPTYSNNLCQSSGTYCAVVADPLFTNQSGKDFSLLSGSPAINQGIEVTGRQKNGSAPDIGAHETVVLASCTVEDGDASTMRISWQNNLNPPIAGLTQANWSTRKNGSANAVTGIALSGTNRVDLTLTNAVSGGDTIDFTYTPGTLRDSANIGGSANQKAFGLSQQSCTNNVGGGPTGTWEQKTFRWHAVRGTEVAPEIERPANININIVKGGSARLRIAVIRNTADTLSLSPKLYCSLNGGAYFTVPGTFDSNNIRLHGTGVDPDIPSQGTATTNLLGSVGAGSFVAGALARTADAIPSVSIAPTNWTEMEWALDIDANAAAGDYYDCRARDQDGTAFSTYTITPRMTVVGDRAAGGF